MTLGLQNSDELNFGVPGFWSYFFPFPEVTAKFEEILDAWVEGRARITRLGLTSRLQVAADVTAEMASRLAAALGTTAQYSLNLQNAVDLYTRKRPTATADARLRAQSGGVMRCPPAAARALPVAPTSF